MKAPLFLFDGSTNQWQSVPPNVRYIMFVGLRTFVDNNFQSCPPLLFHTTDASTFFQAADHILSYLEI